MLPNYYDKLALRYFEYYEYFWTGNNKDWHLESIKKSLKEEEYESFLDYIHSIISFPISPEYKFIQIMQMHKKKLYFRYYVKKIIEKIINKFK